MAILVIPLFFTPFCSLHQDVKTQPQPEERLKEPEKPDATTPAEVKVKPVTKAKADSLKDRGTTTTAPIGDIFQTGMASWYGGKFQGRRTASGEIYDMYKLTAAHNTLPFNTLVEVENLDNGKRVRVRINDRGPFVKNRILDLSYKAAQRIGSDANGVAPVTLRIVDGASKATFAAVKRPSIDVRDTAPPRTIPKISPKPTPTTHEEIPLDSSTPTRQGSYFLQAGAFSEEANALKMQKNIKLILADTPFRIKLQDGLYKVVSPPHLTGKSGTAEKNPAGYRYRSIYKRNGLIQNASGGPPGAPTRRAQGGGSPLTPYMRGFDCTSMLKITLKLFSYEIRPKAI